MRSTITSNELQREASRCIGCGYQLTGLPLGGDCPECGLSVARSILRDNAWTNVRWLREFSLGASGIIGTLLLLIGSILLGTSTHQLLIRSGEVCRPIALAGAGVFGVTLAWRYPWDVNVHQWRIFRWCLLISAAIAPATIVSFFSIARGPMWPDLIVLHLILEFVLIFIYLQSVAMRLYEYPLMMACRVWIVAMILLVALPFIAAWGSTGAPWHDNSGMYRFFMVIPCALFAIAILAQQVVAAREAMALASRERESFQIKAGLPQQSWGSRVRDFGPSA